MDRTDSLLLGGISLFSNMVWILLSWAVSRIGKGGKKK